jgi:transcriptional regulator GlxA family with amidase domain
MQPINQFIREAEVSLPGRDSIIHSLTELIAHQLIRSLLDITTGSIKSGNYRTMYHIVDYMYQHFDKKLEVSELAKLAGLSESYFTRTFKKETHFSPMEYLNKIRMNNAKNLLKHSYENISEVALMCGFNNCSHFTSRFTKENGISPTAYKKNYRISG